MTIPPPIFSHFRASPNPTNVSTGKQIKVINSEVDEKESEAARSSNKWPTKKILMNRKMAVPHILAVHKMYLV